MLWANECLSEKCKWSCCLVFRSFMSFPWTDRDKNYNDGVLFITCSSDLAGDIPAHSDKSRISRISSCCKPKLSVFFSQIFRFLHTRQYRPTISPHNTCTFSSLENRPTFCEQFSSEWKLKPQLDWADTDELLSLEKFAAKKVSLAIWLEFSMSEFLKPHKCNNNASFPEISNVVISRSRSFFFAFCFYSFQFPVHDGYYGCDYVKYSLLYNILMERPWWVSNDWNWYFLSLLSWWSRNMIFNFSNTRFWLLFRDYYHTDDVTSFPPFVCTTTQQNAVRCS